MFIFVTSPFLILEYRVFEAHVVQNFDFLQIEKGYIHEL